MSEAQEWTHAQLTSQQCPFCGASVSFGVGDDVWCHKEQKNWVVSE